MPDEIIYAGYWRRAAAIMIDTVCFILLLFGLRLMHLSHLTTEIVYQPICLAYYAGLESSKWQATVGQRVMKIYLVTEEIRRLSFVRAAVRYLLWMAPIIPCLAYDLSPSITHMMDTMQRLEASTDKSQLVAYMRNPEIKALIHNHVSALLATVLVWILWCAPSIVFTSQKTAPYDLWMKTRVIRGRTSTT